MGVGIVSQMVGVVEGAFGRPSTVEEPARSLGIGVTSSALAELYARFGLRPAFVSATGAQVWRSRSPHMAEAREVALLEGLGLVEVWDLRSPAEREAVGCFPLASRSGLGMHEASEHLYPPAHHGPMTRDDVPGVPGAAGDVLAGQLKHERQGRRQPGERMCEVYQGLGEHAEALAPTIGALVGAAGPTLVYCTSGKDRTGVVCYCAQRALGASHDEALASYLETNKANARVNADDLLALGERGVPPWRLEVALSLFLAKEEYLEVFLGIVRERYGSLEAYLERCLRGVGPANGCERARLRVRTPRS